MHRLARLMNNPLSLAIGCPHPLKTQGVTGILTEGGHTVCGVAPDTDSLTAVVNTSTPDIVVLDGCLCGDDMGTVRKLAQRGLTVAVLAGTERDSFFIQEALMAGARGCLCCDDSADRFLHSIELLAQGTMVISREHSDRLTHLAHSQESRPDVHLTSREQQIAAMVARGATNREIADELFLSTHTVKIHIKNILDKLDLRNRQQLAAYVAREGLVEGIPVAE